MTHTYLTHPGDTLWDIAAHFYGNGTQWPQIYEANRRVIGDNPRALHAGLTLTIPDHGPQLTPGLRYITRPGDTLWDLALRFFGDGTRWTDIYNANRRSIGDNPGTLQPGLALYIPSQSGPGHVTDPAQTPRPLNGATISDAPAALYAASTRSFHAFAHSTNGRLVQHFADGWQDLGAPPVGVSATPGAVLRAPVAIHIGVRGSDTRMYHKFHDGHTWSGWENRGGDLASGPSLASWNPGRLDFFALGLFQNLIHCWWEAQGGWSTWQDVSPQLPTRTNIQHAPSAASWGPNRLDVFAVRANDSHLLHAWWDGRAWQGWEDLGGTLTDAPAVVAPGSNRLDVFARGSDGHAYRLSYDGHRWGRWIGLGITIASAPAAALGPMGLSLFARSAANQLVQFY